MFYLIRAGRPLTDAAGNVRIFANALEMGRLQRGDQPMIYRPDQPPRTQTVSSK